MVICNECGAENQDGAVKCGSCGAELPADTVPATSGASVEAGARGGAATLIVNESTGDVTDVSAAPGPQTRQLDVAAALFAPLPEGVMLTGVSGEYRVQVLRKDEADLHQYQAVSVHPSRVCPHCAYLHNPATESRCLYCRGELGGVPESHLPVTVLESRREDVYGVLSRLAKLNIHSPNLRLPLDAFSRRVGGLERHFLVLPPPPTASLSSRKPPQEAPDVLVWGISLAGALEKLHAQQVAFGAFTSGRLGLEAKQASLAEFSKAIFPGRDRLYRHDLIHLAGFLFFMLTGEQRYQERADLPGPVAELFARALGNGAGFETAAEMRRALEGALANLRRPASVDYLVGRRTDVGMVRQLNEDSLLALHMVRNNKGVNYPLGIFAVADGMGGHTAGEIASGLALQAVAQSALEYLLSPEANTNEEAAHAEWVAEAVTAANTAVHEQVEKSKSDMGTTLVLSLLVGDQLFLANVGDSRAYLVNQEGIRQVTEDHSLVERLVASGQISRMDARSHPQRNVIYRTIGDRSDVEPDMFRLQVKAGDRLLLCSDGLSGMVEDEQILRIMGGSKTPQVACDALIVAANQGGGTDNITAVIVQIEAIS